MTDLEKMYSKTDALRIHGLRVWTQTLERVADDDLDSLDAACKKARLCWGRVTGTDPKKEVEAWAEYAALADCLWHGRGDRGLTVSNFMAGLEGIVLGIVKRNVVPVDPSVSTTRE